MFPHMRTGNIMLTGWYVKFHGGWVKIISKIGDDGFKTTYLVQSKGENKEIVLNNKEKFEVQIKGMM